MCALIRNNNKNKISRNYFIHLLLFIYVILYIIHFVIKNEELNLINI